MALYELIIRGGRVIDPARGIDGKRDVAVKNGKIAAVAESIPPVGAELEVDASGKVVTPGLIDMHAHVYWRATKLSLDPDEICPRTGVTTVVDAGTAGAATFGGFRHFVIEPAKTRVIPFLHASSIGLTTEKESRYLDHVDVEEAVECVREHRDLIAGIKVRANKMGVGDQSVFPIYLARDIAEVTGLPLMVDMYYPPPSVEQVFPLLRPGDISTHIYKGYHGGLLRHWNAEVRPAALEARERGVFFDLGHGAGSFSWEVAKAACDLGFFPDTISTDLHQSSARQRDCTMPDCMAKMMSLGASLEEVVRWATATPAQVLKRDDLGSLKAGASADITILEVKEGHFSYHDVSGKPSLGRHKLQALFTVCRGVVTYDQLSPVG